MAYSSSGQIQLADQTVEENIRRNPDYLFGRLNYAEMLLQRWEVDRVAEIFENKFDLQMLYPKRKRSNISEVTGFMGIMGWYFVEIGQRDIAQKYYEILKEIAPHHPITKRLRRRLLVNWVKLLFSKDARND